MSTIKADGIEASTGTNTDLTLAGKGTGVPDLAAGFKVGSVAGVPTASIRDDAVTLAKLAAGTDGELITWDASGDPAAVAVGTATHVLTSNGAGAAPTFQAAGGGAWAKVANSTGGTDVASIEYTALGTKDIWMRLRGVSTNSGGGQSLRLQIAQGGSFVTSGTGYNSAGFFSEGSDAIAISDLRDASYVDLDPGRSGVPASVDAIRDYTIDITILNPGGTTEHKAFRAYWTGTNDGAGMMGFLSGSFDTNTTALSGFKVYGSSSNIDFTSYEIMELN